MSITNFNATTPQLKAVKDYFDAFATRDLKNVQSLVSKDYSYETFPKVASLHDKNKEETFERYGLLFSFVTKFEANAHQVIEAPGKVVVHSTTVFHSIDGDELEYDSVGIFTLVEENGEPKVINVKDFADSEKRGKIHGWAAKALGKSAA